MRTAALLLFLSVPAAAELTQLQLDQLFDGTRDVRIVNGQLERFAATYRRTGTTVEVGHLGLSGSRNGLIGLSPYLNVRQRFLSQPRSRLDHNVELTAGGIDLAATYFNDRPGPDAGVDLLLQRVAPASREYLGYADYSDPMRTTRIAVASVLAQVGRAYELYGPVDIGWAASSLVKSAYLFPNAAFDVSAGPRVDIGGDRSVSVYGGWTRNLSPAGNRLLQGVFSGGKPDLGVHWEDAPHAALGVRGPVPTWRELYLEAAAARQWNADTVADTVRGALETSFGGRPAELSATLLAERGARIEFQRRRLQGEFAAHVTPALTAAAGYQRESIRYGSASIDNRTFYSRFRMKFGPGGGQSAELKWTTSGRDVMTTAPVRGFEETVGMVNQALGAAIGVAEGAQFLLETLQLPGLDPGATQEAARELVERVREMEPEDRRELYDTLLGFDPTPAQRQYIDEIFYGDADVVATLPPPPDGLPGTELALKVDLTAAIARMRELQGLLELMSSDGVMERLAVRVGRNRLLDALAQTNQPIKQLGTTFRWSPGALLAAASIMNSRPSPVAPITSADVKDSIEPWLWRGLARHVGLPETAGREQVTSELLARVGDGLKQELKTSLGDALSKRMEGKSGEEAVADLRENLPPSALKRLQQRYGEDLSGLVTAGMSGRDVLNAAVDGVVEELVREKLGPLADAGGAALSQWLGGVIQREIDTMMVQALLAAEQFDPMYAGQGRKVGELGRGMVDLAHDRLAERKGRLLRATRGALSLLQPA